MRRRAHSAALALLAGSLALAVAACRSGPSPGNELLQPPRLVDGLGGVHHAITTRSPLAQRYFDQGLALLYAYHHESAIDSFREAARLDPHCAMCWWGIAFALGPNLDAPMAPGSAPAAWEAIRQLRRRVRYASPLEREWIAAIEARYADPSLGGADRGSLDRAFADAMGQLYRHHPEDLDAAVLFAEAQMDLSPWHYWTDDGEPGPHTEEIQHTLQWVLASNPDHVGAMHLAIHLWERFQPERAEAIADRLLGLAPAAGHLLHVPSHVYYRVGRYADAVEANELAAAADVAWFTWSRAPRSYAASFYTHNLHLLWASALAEGSLEDAMRASRRLVAQIPADQLAAFPFLEDRLTTPLLTLARFGLWDAVLDEPAPPPERRFQTAMWHYARGLAYAREDALDDARAELSALQEIVADPVLAARVFDFAGGTAGQRLAMAQHHLEAELSVAGGDVDGAVAGLRQAIVEQDALPYVLPPPFYLPLRQVLGGVLLDADRPREAEAVFREDLARYPDNGWSLFGLRKSLQAQGKRTEARAGPARIEIGVARGEGRSRRSAVGSDS